MLFNHHPSTMPWLLEAIQSINGPVLFAIQHDLQLLRPDPFHFLLCPDPTLSSADPRTIGLPRFIPDPIKSLPPEPEVFTVSSFGFATPGKGFEHVCRLVDEQFDEALVQINIPPHDSAEIASQRAFDEIVDRCHAAITKPGIRLDVTKQFMSDKELIGFLAESTMNAFAYDRKGAEGISSCTDYALAAKRPIAISGSPMFKHLHQINPSIRLDQRPLIEIARHGFAPLVALQQQSSTVHAGRRWNEAILQAHKQLIDSREMPDGRGFNKILDDRSRTAYAPTIAKLKRLAPEIFDRKIERANVQQAFAFHAVESIVGRYLGPRILAVGSFEDTAVAALKADGYRLDEIDPNVNGLDLASFYALPTTRIGFYDLIVCVSVLEHVENDERFVRMIADLLAPNGTAIFTVDFSERYAASRSKPAVDYRLYRSTDLASRLMRCAQDCVLINSPKWTDLDDDFEFEGCRYSFAAWVFRKRSPDELVQTRVSTLDPLPAWPERLEVGVQAAPGARTVGCYAVESYRGHPLRWTSKSAEIALPLNPKTLPKSIEARFWGIAPPGGTEFRLLANGVELVHVHVGSDPIEHTVSLPDLEGRERLLIRLESSGFQAPDDPRILGVAIASIALLQ